ncbi:MAG TPA: PLP-dependent aminotransferase family protein [Steroidobacteraceae bacterium]|nr:PLP-dependent aminotransferase family protein [Steroidobacteraceae bacterium]
MTRRLGHADRSGVRLKAITIKKSSTASIQQQIYARLRAAIIDGSAQADERLPSARGLAAQLNIARGTVDLAYARLAEEGFIVSRGQRGTFVAPGIQRSVVRPQRRHAVGVATINEYLLPFRLGVPALDLFPRKVWSRLAARQARRMDVSRLTYPDPAGLLTLREAIASYVAVARGIACEAQQIVVTTGYQGALHLVAHLVLKRGDSVWLEDPCYGFALHSFKSLAMRIVPVPVDDQGLRVADGRTACLHAALAVVTPAHQFPMGVTLSQTRRQALIAWAAQQDAWILEDDYDCEFHYNGQRPPALKSIDGADRVFYAGSFSKTIFPALRLGYLVVPRSLVEEAQRACRTLHRGAAVLEQSVVASFMAEGHFARHLQRMRIRYRARRQALAEALRREFGESVDIVLEAGGLHLLARFSGLGPDVELERRAREHGLIPHALSTQSITPQGAQGLLLSFTNIQEHQAPRVAAALRRSIG